MLRMLKVYEKFKKEIFVIENIKGLQNWLT